MFRSPVTGAVTMSVTSGDVEGEFIDRASLDLPGFQERLIRAVSATGTPTVVVLVGGSAITMDSWLVDVGAVIDAWYPGEVGGTAVAEVLFGDYNPAGRLPITFPRSIAQLPLYYNHKPTGRLNENMQWVVEPGEFLVMIGASSEDIRLKGGFEVR